jgi:hypothetical protein
MMKYLFPESEILNVEEAPRVSAKQLGLHFAKGIVKAVPEVRLNRRNE